MLNDNSHYNVKNNVPKVEEAGAIVMFYARTNVNFHRVNTQKCPFLNAAFTFYFISPVMDVKKEYIFINGLEDFFSKLLSQSRMNASLKLWSLISRGIIAISWRQ